MGGGGGICIHFKDKYSCKECAAAGIGGPKRCIHDKIVGRCVECGGANICEHKKVRQSCKFCLKVRACVHNKKRNMCLDCKPIRELGAMGVAIKAHELLTLFETEKFYFHPKRDAVKSAIEELRKYSLAHAPVPEQLDPILMVAVDVGGAGEGSAGQGGQGGEAGCIGVGEHGTLEGGGEGGAGNVGPRTPGGVSLDPFIQDLNSKSLSEIMGDPLGAMGYANRDESAMKPIKKSHKKKQPVIEDGPNPNTPAPPMDTDPLKMDELLLSIQHEVIPPQEYQKMMTAAHHLMAQHVLVMQEMKTASLSPDVDMDDVVLPCPHGKKSRLVCKACREDAAATRKTFKEKAAAASGGMGGHGDGGAAGGGGVGGQGDGGAVGGPSSQGAKGKETELPKEKKEAFHSLNEYTRMLNAADFLMREHIKTTKELNTSVEQKLQEKRQMELVQKQQHDFMVQNMEPPKLEAAELAKQHHHQILGLRVGPSPSASLPLGQKVGNLALAPPVDGFPIVSTGHLKSGAGRSIVMADQQLQMQRPQAQPLQMTQYHMMHQQPYQPPRPLQPL